MTTTYWKRVAAGGLFLFAAILACTIPAFAQQTLGSINGTVLDPSGASVAEATVTDPQIDVTRTAKSSSNGFFQIFNLPIGTYSVKITHEGFETTTLAGIGVQEARATTINGTLTVGKVSESVEVTANPLLNATDSTNGYTLDAAQIAETPLPTGSFTGLAILSPGVNSELGSGVGSNSGLGNQPIWANGQRDTSNTMQVNGVDATNLFNGKTSSSASSQRYNFNIGSSASGGVGQAAGGLVATGGSVYGSNGNGLPAPPPEFTQELRVNTSMYDAQQGAPPAHRSTSTPAPEPMPGTAERMAIAPLTPSTPFRSSFASSTFSTPPCQPPSPIRSSIAGPAAAPSPDPSSRTSSSSSEAISTSTTPINRRVSPSLLFPPFSPTIAPLGLSKANSKTAA